jgi:ABC-type polysaccharide transport system permease subunit
MEKHISKTRAELITNIRGFVYTQIIKGAGWCDEAIDPNRMRWFLDMDIDNQTDEEIYTVYKQLFDGGYFDGVNGDVFKKKQYAVYNHTATMNIIISIIILASFGQGVFIFSIAIQNLNKRYLQLAEVDGCSRIQVFFKVIVPNINKYILYFAISLLLWCITGAFPLIQVLTNGGPGYMSTTLDYYTYIKAFLSNSDYGIACASAVVQLLIILCFFAIAIVIRQIWRRAHVAKK